MNVNTILSAYPVPDAMRDSVLATLTDLERRCDGAVILECGSDSRGCASPDSEYDVRFVYVNRFSWYLTVDAGRDVIGQPISDELDPCMHQAVLHVEARPQEHNENFHD